MVGFVADRIDPSPQMCDQHGLPEMITGAMPISDPARHGHQPGGRRGIIHQGLHNHQATVTGWPTMALKFLRMSL